LPSPPRAAAASWATCSCTLWWRWPWSRSATSRTAAALPGGGGARESAGPDPLLIHQGLSTGSPRAGHRSGAFSDSLCIAFGSVGPSSPLPTRPPTLCSELRMLPSFYPRSERAVGFRPPPPTPRPALSHNTLTTCGGSGQRHWPTPSPAAVLTPAILAQIFSGQIVAWDDPAIVALNPDQGPLPPSPTTSSSGEDCQWASRRAEGASQRCPSPPPTAVHRRYSGFLVVPPVTHPPFPSRSRDGYRRTSRPCTDTNSSCPSV